MEEYDGDEGAFGPLFNQVLGSVLGGWCLTVVIWYAFSFGPMIYGMILGFFIGLFCAYITYESSGIDPDLED